jgi:uncharacterized membrane protein SirB2
MLSYIYAQKDGAGGVRWLTKPFSPSLVYIQLNNVNLQRKISGTEAQIQYAILWCWIAPCVTMGIAKAQTDSSMGDDARTKSQNTSRMF